MSSGFHWESSTNCDNILKSQCSMIIVVLEVINVFYYFYCIFYMFFFFILIYIVYLCILYFKKQKQIVEGKGLTLHLLSCL